MPILGDIPIVGYLFRSLSESEQRTTLQFHITPRLIQGPRGFSEGDSGG
jgi:type II secretory pathway component GspD/PulD (secretin)